METKLGDHPAHRVTARLRQRRAGAHPDGPEGLTTTYDYDIWQRGAQDGSDHRRQHVVHTYRTYYTYDHLSRETHHTDTEDEGTPSAVTQTWIPRYNAHGDARASSEGDQTANIRSSTGTTSWDACSTRT